MRVALEIENGSGNLIELERLSLEMLFEVIWSTYTQWLLDNSVQLVFAWHLQIATIFLFCSIFLFPWQKNNLKRNILELCHSVMFSFETTLRVFAKALKLGSSTNENRKALCSFAHQFHTPWSIDSRLLNKTNFTVSLNLLCYVPKE